MITAICSIRTMRPAAPVILQDASGVPRLYHLAAPSGDGRRTGCNPRWIIAYSPGWEKARRSRYSSCPTEREASPAEVKFVSPVPGSTASIKSLSTCRRRSGPSICLGALGGQTSLVWEVR